MNSSPFDPSPPPIHQVLRCQHLLREGWHDKVMLAQRLSVSPRTVKRYLRAISEEVEGFEVREVDDRGLRHYRIDTRFELPRRRGSPYEVMALAISERFFRAFDPGGVADLLDHLLFDLTGEEDESDEEQAEVMRRSLRRRFVLARPPQPLPGKVRRVMDRVIRGLVEQRMLRIEYQGRKGEIRRYDLRPYTLVLGDRELAIIGAIGVPDEDGAPRSDDSIRTFALHRIRAIERRSTRFQMPNLAGWDPEAIFGRSWGLYLGDPEPVSLRIHPFFAEILRSRIWHPSQRVGGTGTDGWLDLNFELFTGGEFRTWLLGWGPWVEVVEPASLRSWWERMREVGAAGGEPEPEEIFRIV